MNSQQNTDISDRALLLRAAEARERAYAPYSRFRVGAALLAASGEVYVGCNVENAAYTPTNCAERTAFFRAVSEGEREFVAIAVVGGRGAQTSGVCTPCGVCRQVMAEFCRADFRVVMGEADAPQVRTLGELLPESFGLAASEDAEPV